MSDLSMHPVKQIQYPFRFLPRTCNTVKFAGVLQFDQVCIGRVLIGEFRVTDR
jgi:hypothetical protein